MNLHLSEPVTAGESFLVVARLRGTGARGFATVREDTVVRLDLDQAEGGESRTGVAACWPTASARTRRSETWRGSCWRKYRSPGPTGTWPGRPIGVARPLSAARRVRCEDRHDARPDEPLSLAARRDEAEGRLATGDRHARRRRGAQAGQRPPVEAHVRALLPRSSRGRRLRLPRTPGTERHLERVLRRCDRP